MITLNDIEFSYAKKGTPALTAVTAVIEPGVHLLAGENGAGKTTLLHIIAGLIKPGKGECLIDGNPVRSNRPADMGKSFLLEETMPFTGKCINEFAKMHSRFYPRFSEEAFKANLAAFGQSGNEPFKTLSLGNLKKAQLSYVLALGVDVLLLDEPTNGLDIESKATLRKLFTTNLREDQTAIIATHTITELETLFEGALMLTGSRLLFAGTGDALTERLAFRVDRIPDPEAIYTEIKPGKVLNICPAMPGEETRVDWRLLYSALHSPKRNEITKILIES